MTRYLMLIAYLPGTWEEAGPSERQVYVDTHAAFQEYVEIHGRHHASAALADTDEATTVRRRDGRVVVTDGPFAETTEMIGGYYEVELPDLDSAIAAASLLHPSYSVEIRPTITVP